MHRWVPLAALHFSKQGLTQFDCVEPDGIPQAYACCANLRAYC